MDVNSRAHTGGMNMNWFQKTYQRGLRGALLGSAFLVASWAGAQATSLEEAVRLSLATNPDIGVVAHNREAVDAELRQARGLYLPQIDLATGIGREWTNDRNTRARSDGGDTRDLALFESALRLTQPVFTGFETFYTVERDKARVQSAADRVFENSEFLALDAVGVYHEVLRQRGRRRARRQQQPGNEQRVANRAQEFGFCGVHAHLVVDIAQANRFEVINATDGADALHDIARKSQFAPVRPQQHHGKMCAGRVP